MLGVERQCLVSVAPALFVLLSASGWIPFETTPQLALPIVGVRFNGSEPYRMIVDPTVKEILVDESLVLGTGMKVVKRGEVAEIDYYAEKETVEVAYLEGFEAAGVRAPMVRFLLIDGDDTTASDGVKIYGRVGSEFWSAYRVTFYYPRHLMLVEASPPGELPPGGVPFDAARRFLEVPVTVNGKLDGYFIIDPGASHSIVDRKWARDQHLVDDKATLIKLGTLKIGGLELGEVPAVLDEMGKLPYRRKGRQGQQGKTRAVGVLGATLLKKLALTYDFPRSLIWLRSPQPESSAKPKVESRSECGGGAPRTDR